MASRLETSQEFEAAFEELYRQSPMPQMSRPSFITRQNPMPLPTQPIQNGSGIKAIFDMMKLKNSSMSSCLNTSVATASTSGGDADTESHHDNDAQVKKDKENLTPEKNEGQRTQAELPSVSTAARLSPPRNSSDEIQADKDTLLLVSKLVQCLRSSADAGENNSNSDDSDTELLSSQNSASHPATHQTEPVTMAISRGIDISQQSARDQSSKDMQSLCHISSSCGAPATDVAVKDGVGDHFSKKTNSAHPDKLDSESSKMAERHIEENKTTTCVRNLRSRSKVIPVLNRNNKGQSINTKNVKKTSTTAKLTLTQQNNSKNVATTTLRKKRGTVRSKDSSGDKVLAQAAAGKLHSVKNTQPRNLLGAQDATDEVDADVILTKATGKMYAGKDPFSLDSSCSDFDLEVEEDAILLASKKSQIPKRGRKKGSDKKLANKAAGNTARSEQNRVAANGKEVNKNKNKMFRLSSWSLQPVPRMKSVRIEGKLPNTTYFWLSSVIMERISSRRVKSTNGSVYMLVGNISARNTLAAGFSKELVPLFRSGFPENWKDLVESSIHSTEWNPTLPLKNTPVNHPAVKQDGSLKKMNSTLPPKETALSTPKSREKRKSLKRKNITLLFQKERKGSELALTPAKTPHITPRKPTQSKAALGEVSVTPKSAVNAQSLKASPTIWTPQGVVSRALEATEVRRTLSGRAVIPPLARWAGQFLQRDDDGSVTIGFASLTAEKHFAQLAEKELHVPKRMRNSSLANSYLQMKSPFTRQKSPLARRRTNKPRCPKALSSEPHELSSQPEESTVHAQQSTRESLQKTFETDSMRMDVSVDDMMNEVMELVHRSKARRTKTVEKRITCYSVVSQQKSEEVLSSSFKYSQQEESITDSQTQAETVSASNVTRKHVSAQKMPQDVSVSRQSKKKQGALLLDSKRSLAQQSAGAVRPTRRKKTQSDVQIVPSDADDHFDFKTVSNSHTQSIQQKKIQSQSGDFVGEDKQDESSSTSQRTNISDCREDTGVKEQKKQNGSSRQPISQQTTRGRGKGVKSDRGKTKQSTRSLSLTKKKTRSDQTVSSSSEDALQGAPKTTEDLNSSSNGQGKNKTLNGAPKTRQRNGATLAAQEDARPWTQEEKDKLHEAAKNINSKSCQFWEEVSQHVGTRSVKECIAFHLKDKPNNTKSSKMGRPKDVKKAKQEDKAPQSLQLQAKKGTLKRRREVRAILEQDCNDSCVDALFLGTPFRSKKKAKVVLADFSKTEEEVFGRNPDFFTPKRDGLYSAGTAFSHTPVSARKTPAVAPAHSPCLSKDSGTSKKDVDQYMFRLKKNKRQLKKTFQKEQTIRRLVPESAPSIHHTEFKSVAAPNGLFRISEGQSCNDDEEEDYYYSESDDADN